MELTRANKRDPKSYFSDYRNTCHRQYDALRAFFHDDMKAEEVAKKFGYTIHAMYNLIKDFKQMLRENPDGDPFFIIRKTGRKEKEITSSIKEIIINLRKQYLSSPDIKIILDSRGYNISERHITTIIKREGFARLPRRTKKEKIEKPSRNKPRYYSRRSKKEKKFAIITYRYG